MFRGGANKIATLKRIPTQAELRRFRIHEYFIFDSGNYLAACFSCSLHHFSQQYYPLIFIRFNVSTYPTTMSDLDAYIRNTSGYLKTFKEREGGDGPMLSELVKVGGSQTHNTVEALQTVSIRFNYIL